MHSHGPRDFSGSVKKKDAEERRIHFKCNNMVEINFTHSWAAGSSFLSDLEKLRIKLRREAQILCPLAPF